MNTWHKMNTLRKMNVLREMNILMGGNSYRLYSAKDQKAKPQEKPKGKENPQKPVDPSKKTTKVTMINGEGVGAEMMSAVQQVICAVKAPIEWDIHEEYLAPDSEDVSKEILDSLRANKVGIKGPVDSRHWQRQIRKQFAQFAYVSLCSNIEGLDSPYGDFDVVIIRDQMEGDYSGIEHSVVPGVMQTIKVSTTAGAARIAQFVFDYALKHNRKKITVAHKANIMRMTDGNFLEAMHAEAEKHAEKIQFEEKYLDTCILNILLKPHKCDVMVSSSMYGDVMRVITGGMVGVPGICPGYSVSSLGTVFDSRMKACHALEGKDLANPTGPLLCAALMLHHLKMDKQADQLECAVRTVYRDSDIRTPDVGGKAKCSEFVKAVCDCLENAK
ncbi:probable isocitrate dehydrogenase [NAD] subunit alpha, mitochondrial [Drosophila takahashii]|uniref:probable isocitrate dehydrogenase [NAD] subunit alpha, mitochondrial n=1 Tax=Drosophila takahashii TaxID=29030 RepID=UPI001CF87652|nr:probable isocitrate dehydrogenase [NAD] subunit alpha, mitochondrial [Drosophila takahashii]